MSADKKNIGMYYTPKSVDCTVNVIIKGLDCKSRTDDVKDWCENCRKKYGVKIFDIACGSGGFLLKNPLI